MDKKYIEENETEIKYLRKQLSDDELEAFEIYLMENPEMIETLDINAILASDVNTYSHQEAPSSSFMNLSAWRGLFRYPKINLPIAATIGFLVGGAIFSLNDFSGKSTVTEIYTTQYIELVSVRGSDEDAALNTIVIDKVGSNRVGLLLDTGTIGSSSWTIEISEKSSITPILNISALSNDDGYILLSIPEGSLKQGEYSARIDGKLNPESRKYSFFVNIR